MGLEKEKKLKERKGKKKESKWKMGKKKTFIKIQKKCREGIILHEVV